MQILKVNQFIKLIFLDKFELNLRLYLTFFSLNRHKMTIITPSLYSDIYNCDDNRYDLRQFLYPKWEH